MTIGDPAAGTLTLMAAAVALHEQELHHLVRLVDFVEQCVDLGHRHRDDGVIVDPVGAVEVLPDHRHVLLARRPRARDAIGPELEDHRHPRGEGRARALEAFPLETLDVHPEELHVLRRDARRRERMVEGVHRHLDLDAPLLLERAGRAGSVSGTRTRLSPVFFSESSKASSPGADDIATPSTVARSSKPFCAKLIRSKRRFAGDGSMHTARSNQPCRSRAVVIIPMLAPMSTHDALPVARQPAPRFERRHRAARSSPARRRDRRRAPCR